MEVKGIGWLGIATKRVPLMWSFATEALGLRVVGEDTEFLSVLSADAGRNVP